MLAHTDEPIIVPDGDRWPGYVPNVVYTCGAMAHGDVLVLPYGVGRPDDRDRHAVDHRAGRQHEPRVGAPGRTRSGPLNQGFGQC